MTSLLKVTGLKKYFPLTEGLLQRPSGFVQAVEDVSFEIPKGKTVALVGESGCGKTTVGRSILRLLEPTAGQIIFDGEDIQSFSADRLQSWRKKAQMIFQDPYGSLNPRMRVRKTIEEALLLHHRLSAKNRESRVLEVLEIVGLGKEDLDKFPHEFSGGQRQRVGIARALAVEPKMIVADEPVSALDVSIQAQIINLLKDLQKQFQIAFLFISHDLRVVEFFSDEVVVMYLGRVMEKLPASSLRENARHPYTRALISSVPVLDPEHSKKRILLTGEVPDPSQPPSGCVFRTRCPLAIEQCSAEAPSLREVAPGHCLACHLDA